MSDEMKTVLAKSIPDQHQASELIGKLFTVAQPSSVFGEPVVTGDYTIITASEVSVSMGAGFGGGGALKSDPAQTGQEEHADAREVGGGGGGGGFSLGRPVAVISIGPAGVQVEPVVDITKIGLALITALGAMFMMVRKMRQAAGRR